MEKIQEARMTRKNRKRIENMNPSNSGASWRDVHDVLAAHRQTRPSRRSKFSL